MRRLMLAAAAVALLAGPVAAKPKATTTTTQPVAGGMAASTTMTTAPKGTSKMATCAAQWKALGPGQAAYNTKAKTMKSKKGNAMSGYNAFTAECMKKA